MPDAFHYFSYLPFKLREQIWRLAIRPPVPGVHIFSLCKDGEESRTTGLEGLSSTFPAHHPHDSPWTLTAPRCLPKTSTFTPKAFAKPWTYLIDSGLWSAYHESFSVTPMSWTRNNPSTYLIDSGLWSACRESRQVLEHEFRRPEYHGGNWDESKPTVDKDDDKSHEKEFSLFALPGVTSYTTIEGSEQRVLTVMPRRDLVIIQPLHNQNYSHKRRLWNDIIPFYGTGSSPTQRSDFSDYHVAMEYHSSLPMHWSTLLNLMTYSNRGLIKRVSSFWLIDYRIKLNRTGRAECGSGGWPGAKRKVFLGSDRRYVQVLHEDEDDGEHKVGLWRLVDILQIHVARMRLPGIPELDPRNLQFGLLACEYLKGSAMN